MERSTVVCTAPSTGWKKEGQPVPESNLADDSYTGLPQPAHLYVPFRFSCNTVVPQHQYVISPIAADSLPNIGCDKHNNDMKTTNCLSDCRQMV